MQAHFLERLTTSSVIAEVPGHEVALDANVKARRLAELFQAQPDLPGVLLTRHGRVYSAVSRGYYFERVGGYCGKDLYDGRPIHLMMDRFDQLGGALEVAAESSIRAAVERGLERPRELLYEPIIVRGDATAVLVDFEDLLIADSRLSHLRNLQMGQILGTVGEGLLLIREDRRVGSEYSRSAEAVLGTSALAGRTLPELLADRVDPERCRLAGEYLEILFRGNVIDNLVTGLNPLAKVELSIPGEPRPRVAAFRFARSVEGGRVPHILVRIEDITQREQQALELAAQREVTELRLTLAVALAEADPEALSAFLDRLGNQEATLRGLVSGALPTTALARELHALKGEAGLLGLTPFRSCLHELEDRLESPPAGLAGPVVRLAGLVAETRTLLARFRRVGQATAAPADPLARLARFVGELAAELGKEARFVSSVHPSQLPPELLPRLQDALVQLARNALVHGIEPPAQRVAAGKPAVGTLQLAFRNHPGHQLLELIFQDDGAGLALDREPDLARRIFEPGFSTADGVDEHAGRGVGLGVVKERVEALGGRIAVHSERGRFCAFRILLPERAEVAA
jgi:signal transduction histidine kinase